MRDKDAEKTGAFVKPPGVDDAATLTVIRVPREWARWRLDRVVVATFHRMSRTRAQVVVTTGAFTSEGRKLRSNDRVREGDVVLLWRPPFDEPDVPLHCPVVYEDERLLAIAKPPGLPVHPTARYHHKTVTAVLAKERPGEFLALCHRIDRETSGVLLLAKDREAERFVKTVLEERAPPVHRPRAEIEKRYLAITWGVPEPTRGRIALSMKLDLENRLGVKMKVADGDPDALEAATRYEVLETRGKGKRYALVQCDLETGRQHQIRLHLAATNTPIVGDKLYGPDDALFERGVDGTLTADDVDLLELPRHALHAHRLVVPNPSRPMEGIEIIAPLPADLRAFWEGLAM